MPDLNGLEMARILGPEARIVFTTAFEQYAVDGYKVNALDYLLKPVSYPEFMQTPVGDNYKEGFQKSIGIEA